MLNFKIGHGYDVHRLEKNRKLILGGVEITHYLGLAGHSDADVVIHALIDAVLGALGLGDIGQHFPDSDDKYKDIDSVILLKHIYELMKAHNFIINNIDITIIIQEPKISSYKNQMRKIIAETLNCDIDDINIKAKTEERLGFTGQCEGAAAHAVVLLKSISEQK